MGGLTLNEDLELVVSLPPALLLLLCLVVIGRHSIYDMVEMTLVMNANRTVSAHLPQLVQISPWSW